MRVLHPPVLAAMLLACLAAVAAPATALTYEVHAEASGAAELDDALPQISALIRLAREEVPDGFALVARARDDAERLEDAARSLGFHAAAIDVHIDGLPLDDAALTGRLDAAEGARAIPVDISIAPGPAYRLRRIAVEGLSGADGPRPPLAPGAAARARDIVAAGVALRVALREAGHAFARVEIGDLLVDHAARAVDVAFVADPGPRLALGTVSLGGLASVDEDFARRRMALERGAPYDPRRIAAARDALSGTGLFASVAAREGLAADAEGRLPVAFDVVERPARSFSAGAGYATDEGATLALRWLHRNLFGGGEQLRLSAEASRLLLEAVSDPTGRLDAQLRIPDGLARGYALRLDIGAVRERLDAYDREAVFAGAAAETSLAAGPLLGFGLFAERSHVVQGDTANDYTLLSTPATLDWDTRDNHLEPTRGWRLDARIAPTRDLAETHAGFLALRGGARRYLDLGEEPGRSVLALRVAAGSILAADRIDVPADRRLYAGGGGSVRGYAYQSIGPRDARGEAAGGLSLAEVTAELRQRFGAAWGAALFVDAGGAAASRTLVSADLRVGVGGGIRYYTPIGPIRVDLGVPLRSDDATGRFGVYIGIGQAF
jgi:translocation and assembly module TamA